MHKKTIIYIGGFELPDRNAAAQRVLANAKIFRELGFNVVLIGFDKNLKEHTNIENTRSSVQGFETWSVPYPRSKKQWFKNITSIKEIEFIVNKYYNQNLHSVVCYNYPAIALYKIKKLCAKKQAFFIADVTEWHESGGGGVLFNIIKWIDINLRMRIVHLQADGLITISKYLTDFYNKKNCNTIKIPTLYDTKNFKFNDLDYQPQETIKLMYAGSAFNLERLDKNRTAIKDRLDKIIIMLNKVSIQKTNFELNIYGLTKENYLGVFPEHKEIIDNLSEKIIFHGRKPHLEIVENIQKSDFTIFIRNIERVIEAGFPSKFSESISYGTPVISNIISNIEEYAVEGGNHFTISLDNEEEQVKKMIEILCMDKSRRVILKKNCIESKIFDYSNYITSTNKFFLSLKKK